MYPYNMIIINNFSVSIFRLYSYVDEISLFLCLYCRLRSSKVLIAGLSGLGAEICKNIILAGVKTMLLLDNKSVSAEDASCQFLVDKTDIGRNVSKFASH